ncbi:MAG: stage III sporulation protein AD [Hespellia sp.]|nr:stage III sporulation protein AD [Hespellia sp.]
MNIIQIAMIGVLGVLLSIQFKSGRAEYGIYMSVAVSILLFGCIVERLGAFVSMFQEIQSFMKIDASYLSTLLKMVGITYVGEFASSVCKDSGYQTIASQIELFSKLSILVLSVPVLTALLQTIQEFLT